jgi:hypothetical protein
VRRRRKTIAVEYGASIISALYIEGPVDFLVRVHIVYSIHSLAFQAKKLVRLIGAQDLFLLSSDKRDKKYQRTHDG